MREKAIVKGIGIALFNRVESGGTSSTLRVSQSAKSSSETVAKNAGQQRRRELEAGFHNLKEVRQQRICRLDEIVDEYLVGYRLRYRSAPLQSMPWSRLSPAGCRSDRGCR